MALDDRLLSDFADSFFGYGDPDAPYWFVGMEEGGGDSEAEVARRLEAWDARGRRALEDLPAYSRAVGVGAWFDDRPRLQPTWAKLVRLLLAAEGLPGSTDDVRAFQRDRLGRPGGPAALVELLPLPSPSTDRWLYGEASGLPDLATRELYRARYAGPRADRIREMVAEGAPRAVVFYGLGYRPWWERVAGGEFVEDAESGALWAGGHGSPGGGTAFVAVPHPVAMGVRNADFERVGEALRRRSG